MIKKLKELSPLSATLVLAAVFAVGAFAVSCSPSDDDASAAETSDTDTSDPDDHDDDGDDHDDDEDGHDDDDDGHGDDDHEDGESEVSAESFNDVTAVWAEVMTRKSELDDIIASKKLLDVHKAAFAVRDHVNMLADKSHELSAGKQADLARGARTVASLAAELDEAGDAEKQEETEALNEKLQTVLNAIADIYPEGTLK